MQVAGPFALRIPLDHEPALLEQEPGSLSLYGHVFLPADLDPSHIPAVILLRPGGSYSIDYWHQVIPGYPPEAYSCALSLAGRGYLVICTDHLGTGQSSRPADGRCLTTAILAQANAAATQLLRIALERATLRRFATDASGQRALAALSPVSAPLIAFGHSMGAMLLLLEAGQFAHFDGLGILGWSSQQLNVDPQAIDALFTSAADEHGYVPPRVTRPFSRDSFYLPDVPRDVIKADEASATVIPAGLYTTDYLHLAAEQAARISVPVLHVMGSHDISANAQPLAEMTAYPGARAAGVCFFELANSAHCHNYASTRFTLWEVMASWASFVVRTQPIRPRTRAHPSLAAPTTSSHAAQRG